MTLLTERNINIVKIALYGGLLFFSFFVIIAVPVTSNKLDYCLLYTSIENGKLTIGKDSNCNYCVAMAVIFQLLYGAFRVATLVLMLLGILSPDFVLFGDLFQLVYTAIDAVAWFLVFISACIMSAGINSFCSSFSGVDCTDLSKSTRDDGAVSRMRTAEAGAWISFVLWLVLMLLGIFWLFRQGKLPFFNRGAASGGATSDGTSGTSPQMDTPPVTDDPKY